MSSFSGKELWTAWLAYRELRSTALAVRYMVAVYGYRAATARALVEAARAKHGRALG